MATVVEGDSKAPLSIATTPRCWEGAAPYPGLLHFTLDPYLIVLIKAASSTIFFFFFFFFFMFGMTLPGIEPQTIGEHSDHCANDVYIYIYVCVC